MTSGQRCWGALLAQGTHGGAGGSRRQQLWPRGTWDWVQLCLPENASQELLRLPRAGSTWWCPQLPPPSLPQALKILSCECAVGLLLLLLMAQLVHLLQLIYSPATPQRKAQPGGNRRSAKPKMMQKVAWVQSGGATVPRASQLHPLFYSSCAKINYRHVHSFLRNQ